ncbi:PQQ-dependent sugar dehydrogenase [Haloarchaeobius sp. HRN-SO-5]|uniref:PQQ-dependent sugar dehydrogenase n=1 Tax=Haloarchaeobius sp. HRN-SO-5 TaxID=3446118 RepID=UPI003EC057F5
MSPTPPTRRQFLAASGALGLAGCLSQSLATEPNTATYDRSVDRDRADWAKYDPDWTAPTDSPLAYEYETEVLVENLEIPWDLSFTGTDELFLTERTGTIRRFESGDVVDVVSPDDAIDAGAIEPGDEQTWWVDGGEGGLLGVAAHPGFPDPPLVYAYYTYRDGDGRYNRVASFDASAEAPNRTQETIVDDIPGTNVHNGGRIAFGPDGYLWITTGEANERELAADRESLGGKVLRVTTTGDPAPGNPETGDRRVFAYGHRNPQCITWLPDTTPVVAEHGPAGKDEVNLVSAGRNSGWPEARTPDEYRNSDVGRPVVNTGNETWAPTGGVFYTGDSVPGLQNRLLVGGLRSQQLVAVTLSRSGEDLPPAENGRRFDADWMDDRYVATVHVLFENEFGRIRHVEQGPNGDLYFVTSNRDGRAREPFPTEGHDVLVRVTQA